VPVLFGAFLDYGHAAGVFLVSAASCIAAVACVVTIKRPGTAAAA
jgi:hypothetical protein